MGELKWWQKTVVYQIYPKSFCDSNGDGIGDIPGIISKLDYLQDLGVGAIWLCPIYPSPLVDNGYDISDYCSVAEEYGTMEDMERLISEADKRNIKIVMDLVFNHTSDKHKWFEESRSSKDNPKRDWYIWRDGKEDGSAPTNWRSIFGGSAWTLDEKTNQYYLHTFASAQPDLNWENKDMRKDIWQMMNFWIDLGVGGFRMDVIDMIGKVPDLKIKENGPKLHEYIQEMHRETLQDKDLLTVGECWGANPQIAQLFSSPDRHELSMVFQFEHIMLDQEGSDKWNLKKLDLIELKKVFTKWQKELNGKGWNSLFWNNHDLPRIVSRWGNDKEYRVQSAKMLAILLHGMQGTPYIYQGEEIGMTNPHFKSIEQYRNVESLNHYQILQDKGMTKEQALMILDVHSRDNSRTPMQWDDSINAGFTTGTPWIQTADNYTEINVKNSLEDKDSILYYYQKLIQLRKNYDVIAYGDIKPLLCEDKRVFAYGRNYKGQKLIVICNFYPTTYEIELPYDLLNYKCILNNYKNEAKAKKIALKPYETLVYCNL